MKRFKEKTNMVLAVIPARSGSKSVLDKNIRPLNAKPLLAYSIEHALACSLIDRVIVSTDSETYAQLARDYGAEVPFLRPAEISGDFSLDIEVFEHVLCWLQSEEGRVPDMCVHLRPTHPVREAADIHHMVQYMLDHPEVDSMRSVSPAKQTPYKMWLFEEDDRLSPVASCDVQEAYNAPRQGLPEAYMQNACIDVLRSRVVLEQRSMTGKTICGYKMSYDFDIDTEDEFLRAEQYLQLKDATQNGKKLSVCCDIDGVLATKTLGNDYAQAAPIVRNIALINRMVDAGHDVFLYTARGTMTGIDWQETTRTQMCEWGVRYTKLMFGKPAADIYIDDRFYPLNILDEIF
jgi:CMP-N,N'-diacetyllegionaminic acid synthase